MIPATGGISRRRDVKLKKIRADLGDATREARDTERPWSWKPTDYEVRRYTIRHWQLPAAFTTRRIPDAWPVMGIICGGIRGESPRKANLASAA